MIVTWAGYAMLCTAAVGACAACAEHLLAHRRYPRRALWIGAMAASVLAPIAISWNAAPALGGETAIAATAPVSGARQANRMPVDLDRIALTLWAVATLSAAAWLVISQARLQRSLAKCERTRIDGDVVIVSPEFGPAVVGIVRPRIVLPAWVLSANHVDRRFVLAHEREHVRARDPLWQLAGLGLAVATPWNLALWWQHKRLRLAIEIDCDCRIVGRYRLDPIRYGELLVRAHVAAPRSVGSALALVQPRSSLGKRVDALLGLPRQSTRRAAAMVTAIVVLTGAVAFVPAPSIRPASTLPPPTKAMASSVSLTRPASASRAAATPADAPRPAVGEPSGRSSARARALPSRVLPARALPPVQITPSGSVASFASPTVAPLPARAVGRAVLVPRAVGGFIRAVAGFDTLGLVRPARPDSLRASAGRASAGGAFGIAVKRDSAGSVARAGAKPPTR